jgi:hypothetical protein
MKATQLPLQGCQERLNLDDKKLHCQRIPLADRKKDQQHWREVV